MPVRFKTDSEYHENFQWVNSSKSSSFMPSPEQAAPIAGLTSPLHSKALGFMVEPPLQRKAKPLPIATTSTTKMFDDEIIVPDDYMLLGSQEKFSHNVAYKDYLTKNRNRVLGTTYVTPPEPQLHQKRIKPAPVVTFDSGAPKRKDEKQTVDDATQTTSRTHPDKQDIPKRAGAGDKQDIPKRAGAGDSSRTNAAAQSAAGKDRETSTKPANSKTTVVTRPHESPEKATTIRKRLFTTEAVKEKKSPAQEHRNQQEAELSGPGQPPTREREQMEKKKEVDGTYAMKYRAGLAVPRQSPKRKSEYQRQYDWKKQVKATPLLAAELIVHNSNAPVRPPKSVRPQVSEYTKEFQPWKLKPVISENDPTIKAKELSARNIRRAKSEMDVTPDQKPPAGSPSRISHDNPRLTQSLNPQRPFFPHKRIVSWTTEYNSNFQPFSKVEYDKGVWKGAKPAHVISLAEQPVVQPETTSSNWVAEVQELREKAEEFRKRSMGTHFSREHVGQLLSEQSKLWDEISMSSTLSALSLEPAKPRAADRISSEKAVRRKERRLRGKERVRVRNESVQAGGVSTENTAAGQHRLAWSSDGGRSTSPSDSVRSIRSSSSPSISTALSEAKTTNSSDTTENGRVQTPELISSPYARRHHYDLTTPNRHGLLLSSPPHSHHSDGKVSGQKQSPVLTASGARTRRKLAVDAADAVSRDQPLMVQSSTQQTSRGLSQPSPTYGKPTPDADPLVDESILEPVDQILETRYVASPQPRKERKLSAVAEEAGDTYRKVLLQKSAGTTRDDDEMSQLSNSMMSVVSSVSSLASEVLERARNRQENFWGSRLNKGKA